MGPSPTPPDPAAAWPGVHLSAPDFAEHRRVYLAADATPRHLEDLYLAAACVRGVPAALQTLERVFVRPLAPTVAGVGLDPTATDALLQRVFEALVIADGKPPELVRYRGQGRLSAWLRIVVLRAAIHERDRLRRDAPEPIDTSTPATELDPLVRSMRAQLRAPLRSAVTHGIDALTDRDRRLLQLSILEGLDNRTIAARLGVHESTISRWLSKAHRALRSRCRHRLQRELAVTPWELDSLLRVFEGEFSVTTGAIWGAP